MIALLALTLIPHAEPIHDRCDHIELNHFYPNGEYCFSQYIFWQYTETGRRVVAWRLVKHSAIHPTKNTVGEWELLWRDGETLRRVTAKTFRQSWTLSDPEFIERCKFPRCKRRGLTQLPIH